MIASELAIGDWVCVAGPVINGEERQTPPMRVVAICETWVHLLIDPEAGDPDEEDIKDIRPVPLTSEILLANGWEAINGDHFLLESKDVYDGRVRVWVSTHFGKKEMIFNCNCCNGNDIRLSLSCVHEFQHALRIAGIEKEIEL